MCCGRCVTEVKKIFNTIKLNPLNVQLGEVVLSKKLSQNKLELLRNYLVEKGFELIVQKNDQHAIIIQRLIIQYLDYQVMNLSKSENLSVYLTGNMNMNYNKISKIFKTSVGITIEKYFIKLKVEKAKELLMLGDIPITNIAMLLGYSSSQSFSTIFKKETGKTPLQYQHAPLPHRVFRDKIIENEKSNKTDEKSNEIKVSAT